MASRPSTQLKLVRFFQYLPQRHFEPPREPLQGGQSNVPFLPLNEAVLCAVHFNGIREGFLTQAGGLPVATDHVANPLL